MSTRCGRAAICAAIVIGLVPTLAVSARAEGQTTYSSFSAREVASDGAEAGSSSSTDVRAGFDASRPQGESVDVSTDEEQSPAWFVRFSAPHGEQLQVGHTYNGARSDSYDGAQPGLLVAEDADHCGARFYSQDVGEDAAVPLAIGRFTVRELERDGEGRLTAFAATFEQNCQQIGAPSIQGSVAWQTASPADPVPTPSASPGNVSQVHVSNKAGLGSLYYYDRATLTWQDPADPAWTRTVVSIASRLPSLPDEVAWPDHDFVSYQSSTGRFTDLELGFATTWYWITPLNQAGRLGPSTLVKVIGTGVELVRYPRTIPLGAATVLHGQVVQLDSDDPAVPRPPVPDPTVLVYVRPADGPPNAPYRFLRRVTGDATGRFALADAPTANTQYEVRFPGYGSYRGDASLREVALVSPQTTLVAARTLVRRHHRIVLRSPGPMRGSRGVIRLQRHVAGRWVDVRRVRVHVSGRATPPRFSVPAKKRGSYLFRAVKPGDARHTTGISRVVHVTVR